MSLFYDVPALLEAAAVPDGTPGRQDIARRIAGDGLIQKRALDLAVQSFVLQAIRELTGPEKNVLRKRCGVPEHEQYSKRAKWSLLERLNSGKLYVHAECATCHQVLDFPQPERPVQRILGPEGQVLQEKVCDIKKPQVLQMLANIKLSHCGHVEMPPQDLWLQIENAWLSSVTAEKKNTGDDRPWFGGGK